MLYNPLSGSWSWLESTSVNYAMHAVKSGARGQSSPTDALSESESEQRSATAGTAVRLRCVVMDCHQEQKRRFYPDGHNKTFCNNKLAVCINNAYAGFGQIF